MKLATILLLSIVLCPGALAPVTLSDIAGDGAVHAVASSGAAQWVLIQALPNNGTTNCSAAPGGIITGCVRTGDANISTSRGTILVPGASQFITAYTNDPRNAESDRKVSLSGIYYLAATGDKISISYMP